MVQAKTGYYEIARKHTITLGVLLVVAILVQISNVIVTKRTEEIRPIFYGILSNATLREKPSAIISNQTRINSNSAPSSVPLGSLAGDTAPVSNKLVSHAPFAAFLSEASPTDSSTIGETKEKTNSSKWYSTLNHTGSSTSEYQENDVDLQDSQNSDEHDVPNNSSASKASSESNFSIFVPKEPDVALLGRLEETLQNNQSEFRALFGETCPPTVQVEIQIQADGRWILQAFGPLGRPKSVGGDEFYPVFTDEALRKQNPKYGRNIPSAIAHVTDNRDGTYLLDFVAPPFEKIFPKNSLVGQGSLDIWFEYTCGIGRMTRPSKDHWKDGGYYFTKHSVVNIGSPPIRSFEPPRPQIDLSTYKKVICFGDSTVGNLCGKFWNKYEFHIPNVETKKNVGSKFMRHKWKDDAMPLLDEWHGESLNVTHGRGNIRTDSVTNRSTQNVALMIGAGPWELASNQGPVEDTFFSATVAMYVDVVKHVQSKYPNVQILWKSILAPHLPELQEKKCRSNQGKKETCIDRVRYLSTSSAYYLYQEQRRVMTEVLDDVIFLDLWNASYLSYHWHMFGDAIHYHRWQNQFFMELFYGHKQAASRQK